MASRALATPKKVEAPVTPAPVTPTEEQIRQRAYELYLKRGGEHGLDTEDWLRAEAELREVSGEPEK